MGLSVSNFPLLATLTQGLRTKFNFLSKLYMILLYQNFVKTYLDRYNQMFLLSTRRRYITERRGIPPLILNLGTWW
jgi:hypothetical protein